jgi:hypothetical protein
MDVRGAWLEPGELKDGYQGPIIGTGRLQKTSSYNWPDTLVFWPTDESYRALDHSNFKA